MTSVTPETSDLKKWENLWVVKILQLLSTAFGLSVPNLYQYKGLPVLYAGYSLLLCLAHIATQICSFISKYRFPSNFFMTVKVLDVCVVLSLLVTNIFSILCAIFLKRRKILKLTGTLKLIEEQLQNKFQTAVEYRGTSLLLQFFAFMILVCILTAYYCILIVRVFHLDEVKILLAIANSFQVISIAVIIMQVHFFSTSVRCLFQLLHKNIEEHLQPSASSENEPSLIHYAIPDALYFLRKYDMLCDSIDMISDVFSHQIFFVVCTIIASVLHGLNGILKELMKEQQLRMDMYTAVLTTSFMIITHLVSKFNFSSSALR